MKKTLSQEDLIRCIEKKQLIGLNEVSLRNSLQPSSMDITLGSVGFLLPHRALAPDISIEELCSKVALETLDLNSKTLLLKNQTYLIETNLEINLDSNLCAKCSPKSSIGRIDVLVRAICSANGVYDIIAHNESGKLYLEITPQSFNIIVERGVAVSQIRVFEESNHKTCDTNSLSKNILEKSIINISSNKLLKPVFEEEMVFLTLEINNSTFGYVAKHTHIPIDLTKINYYDPKDFFEPIKVSTGINKKNCITIEKDKFYIFHTKELISVPLTHSIEMIPYSYTIGDFRAHYAGFFDPGFGGQNGATGVLEIRSSEDIVVFDGQPICSITAYENSSTPLKGYGENNNNYQGQKGPKLSKFFKS